MESNQKNQSTEEEQRITSLQNAWHRVADHSETLNDLNLIIDSIRKGEDLYEANEAMHKVWGETFSSDIPFEAGELKKYTKKVRRMYDEHQRSISILQKPAHSQTLFRKRIMWYAAAAAVLLGFLIPTAYFMRQSKTEQAAIAKYEEAVTGRGEIKIVILSDQTKVTLNVESSLKYPTVFAEERTVELQGGAIFEVTPDSDRPFTVTTTDMNVKVLGTVFDVKAYPDDDLQIVSVVSGKVSVAMGHAPLSLSAPLSSSTPILLEKDNQLKINRVTGNVEKCSIDVNKYLLWTDGTLFFYETPIKEVINMLNRSVPNLVFYLAEGEYPILISGRLDTKEMATMLDPVFRSLGLKYKKSGNNIILYHDQND